MGKQAPARSKNKRPRAASTSSSSSSASQIASDVEVDFQFLDLEDADFHGVSLLVAKLLPAQADFTSLTDTIVSQQNIGLKIVTDSKDGGVCAFGTLLSLRQYRESCLGLQQLVDHIKTHTPADCAAFLTHPKTALFLGERLINIPGSLGPQMHSVLLQDVQWSLSEEAQCPEDEVDFYRFDQVLVYSVFLLDPDVPDELASAGRGKKKRRQAAAAAAERIYLHAEDEALVEVATKQWSWPAGEHDDGNKVYRKFRLCYVLDWPRYSEHVQGLVEALE